MRLPLLAASLVLLAGGVAGCAGPLTASSGSPTSVPLSVARPGHLFKEMYYLTVDHQGNVYADDTMNFDETSGRNRILKLSPSGKRLASFPVTADGLAVDRQGNLYAAAGSAGVQKLSPGGKVLATFGPPSISDARLKGMSALGVAVDHQGNVYVSDSAHAQVIKFAPSGRVLALWR
jgi:sugar lactone lactonase YvrE